MIGQYFLSGEWQTSHYRHTGISWRNGQYFPYRGMAHHSLQESHLEVLTKYLPGSVKPLTAGITLKSTNQILTGEWQTSHCRHHSWRTWQLLTGEWQTYHCSRHHTWRTVQLLTGEWRTSHCRHHTWNIWWWYSCCSGQHTSPSEARKKNSIEINLKI